MQHRTLILALVLLVAPFFASAQTLRPVSYYQKIFDDTYTKYKSNMDAVAASGEGTEYYNMQYLWSGTLAMYEASGDEKYLDRALSWGETAVGKATIRDQDGYLHWSGPWDYWGATGISYHLYDMQGSTELARMARLVLTDTALKAKYGARAQKIADHVKKNIIERHWTEINTRKNQVCAKDVPGMYSDKPLMAAGILLDLYLITKDTKYKDLGVGIAQCFKAITVPYKGGLVWGLEHIPADYGNLDTSHANRVPPMWIAYFNAGLVYTRDDLSKLATLFTDVIWNGSVSDPLVTNYVDGTNTTYRDRGPYTNGFVYAGWADLAAYDCDQYRAIDAFLQALVAGNFNASVARNNTMYGWTALSGKLAKAASSGKCGTPPGTSGGTTGGTTGGLTPGACNGYPAGSTPPTGYAASWNVLSAGRELMLSTMCRADGIDITVGTGAQNQYIYKQRYTYTAGQTWSAVPLNGTLAQGSTDWLVGKGTYSMGIPTGSFFWAAYVCQYINSQWKCGCRDAACATPYWQLQQAVIK